MVDFTIKTYISLIEALLKQGFSFQTFQDFILIPSKRSIILRYDVDTLPENSLQFARIQADKGIKGTYYFRILPISFDGRIISEIYSLGHEIGYHYEDMSLAAERWKAEGGPDKSGSSLPCERRKAKGKGQKYKNEKLSDLQDCKTARPQDNGHFEKDLADVAIKSFIKNLQRLRDIVPVKTICMHGSPMSKWDSRMLWKYYNYRDFGIIGEPYFDINFDEVLYLTDTGRRWDGDSYNIRDKAEGKAEGRRRKAEEEAKGGRQKAEGKRGREGDEERGRLRDEETIQTDAQHETRNAKRETLDLKVLDPENPTPHAPRTPHPAPFPKFHSTFDIIRAAERGGLPDKIMMTFHPQRWTGKPLPWVKELVWQNVKNVGKYFLNKSKKD